MIFKLASPLCLFLLTFNTQAIVISDFTAETNERFKNDATFIGNGINMSGMGRDATGKWLTLIAPDIFISSDHEAPSGTAYFYSDNNITTTAEQRTIMGGQQIANSDLYVGYLNAPVSPNISHYNFSTSLTGLTTSTVTYMTGQAGSTNPTPDSNFPNTQNMLVGQNILDAYIPSSTSFGRTGATLSLGRHEKGGPKYQDYEAFFHGGDSGSPLFTYDLANGVTLLGTAWYTSTVFQDKSYPASVYTYTGAYTKELTDYVTLNSQSQVPEPSATLLLMLSSGLFMIRRHR